MEKIFPVRGSNHRAAEPPECKGIAIIAGQLLLCGKIRVSFSYCLLIAARLTYARVFFSRKCVRTAAKTHGCRQKIPKALALLCLTSGPLPNAANSSDVLRLDSMLRELRKLLRYEKHGCFSWENVFGPPQKPWLWTEKKQKALALLGLRQDRSQML